MIGHLSPSASIPPHGSGRLSRARNLSFVASPETQQRPGAAFRSFVVSGRFSSGAESLSRGNSGSGIYQTRSGSGSGSLSALRATAGAFPSSPATAAEPLFEVESVQRPSGDDLHARDHTGQARLRLSGDGGAVGDQPEGRVSLGGGADLQVPEASTSIRPEGAAGSRILRMSSSKGSRRTAPSYIVMGERDLINGGTYMGGVQSCMGEVWIVGMPA